MRRAFILLMALAFFVIGACNKKEKSTSAEKDLVAELLKENLLATNIATNLVAAEDITEKISNTNLVELQQAQKETSPSLSETEVTEKPKIVDEGIDVKSEKKTLPKRTKSYIFVGNDKSGQSVSPRKFLKLTLAVVVKSEKAESVDFYVYALPKGKSKPSYLISKVRSIKIINRQAQLTKYWNARKVNGEFLDIGEYNIFVKFEIKNENGDIIDRIERYWGNKDFYLKIY